MACTNSFRFGIGPGSSWFSTPLTVGTTNFNLTLSTSLQHSWIPGAELCSSASNKTECREPLGGEFPGSVDGVDSGIATELEKIYPKSLLPARDKDLQSPLGLSGKGVVSKQKITVKSSNAGSFDLGEDLSVGVFTTEKPNFNGYLSLPQISSELFKAGATPGNNFHLWLGKNAETNGSSVPDETNLRTNEHMLIFGGYDRQAFDLNQTQQYRLGADGKIQAELEDLVYRWTATGETDNSLLEDPHTVVIDITTPYLWLPQKSVDKLVTMSGATWNNSMDAYSFRHCFGSDCTIEETNSLSASLDFVLNTGQKITIPLRAFFRLQTGWWELLWVENRPVLPVRALKDDDAPIVLGRAVMAALHLWVDYEEEYFGIKAVNVTEYMYAKTIIAPWGSGHPPITNTSILAADRTDVPSSTSTSTSASGGDNEDTTRGVQIKIIAGVCGGVAVVAVLAGIILLRRRRKKPLVGNLQVSNRYSRTEPSADSIATTTGPTMPTSQLPQAGQYYQLHEL